MLSIQRYSERIRELKRNLRKPLYIKKCKGDVQERNIRKTLLDRNLRDPKTKERKRYIFGNSKGIRIVSEIGRGCREREKEREMKMGR